MLLSGKRPHIHIFPYCDTTNKLWNFYRHKLLHIRAQVSRRMNAGTNVLQLYTEIEDAFDVLHAIYLFVNTHCRESQSSSSVSIFSSPNQRPKAAIPLDLTVLDLIHDQTIPSAALQRRAGPIAVIHNSGVCIPGRSLDAMIESLFVNTLVPIALALFLSVDALDLSSEPTSTLAVVSSGDGERVMVESAIASEVDCITSLGDLLRYILTLVSARQKEEEEEEQEQQEGLFRRQYAVGDTPMYSLSKMMLNKAVQLLHEMALLRVLACCPGNFLSSMTVEGEMEDEEHAVPVEVAAKYVLEVAMECDAYDGGKFYRFGKEINW